ncbi:MAG: PEP-CTERM sorting domain-containing protein [Verrucomicrobia bacterium]|nr:PEP-CTERM sorting domain-containing protein [Verrucomicrobiota bacterium]MCH8526751.1 PEP-CTERM sorting domain-containing protein [Kiritimatiellia bacterium]
MKTQIITLLAGITALTAAQAQISFTPGNLTYSQDFNALPSSSSAHVDYLNANAEDWEDNVTLTGWFASSNVTDTMYISDGSAAPIGGGHLSVASFGAQDTTERALGMVRRGESGFFGVQFVNNTGSTLTELDISFFGEQWRSSDNVHTMQFSYAIDVPTIDSSGFTEVSELGFTTPNPNSNAVDGNAATGREFLSHTLTGLNIADGENVWFRWTDSANNNTYMGIDDFSVTAIPEPGTLALVAIALGSMLFFRRRK